MKEKKKKTLVIVESPTKCKTINKYLGKKYDLASSMGHIIDLPKSRLAVDTEHDFKPEYITIRGKAKLLNELKKKAGKADRVLLATDPDREGEAISWHLARALAPYNSDIKRIEFNEITESAVKSAVENPREIDIDLVNAQQARRILDRLVGYYLSPILWKKVKKGLSAGRVQSVALREICRREREIDQFKPEEYWTLEALYKKSKKEYIANLHSRGGEKYVPTSTGEIDKILSDLEKEKFVVSDITKKERRRKPSPPYITSKLQQDAANRLGFTSYKTMMVAQQLYEGIELTGHGSTGLITYMRTDSTRISDGAMATLRSYITEHYAPEYLPETPNIYANKKNAQDAHEAIRPSNVSLTPDSIKADLTNDQFKLYRLIWERFVSSQMTQEVSEIGTITITAGDYIFKTSGSKTIFAGFTVLDADNKSEKSPLPTLAVGEELEITNFNPEQHFTTPPPRYTDASLVKFLEESGIGRPSTYAPTINTLIKRYYVSRSGRQLVPTILGVMVNNIIENNFAEFISTDFTANMEEKLDAIEDANGDWVKMLADFFTPFRTTVETAESTIDDVKGLLVEETDVICEKCGRNMVKKLGKFGFFLACPGFPECRNSKSLPLGRCPKTGCEGDVVKRASKKGRPFYACSKYPDCDFITRETPSEKACPQCGKLLFQKNQHNRGQRLFCLNEECGYTLEILDE